MTDNQTEKIPANVKKMELALKEMEEIINNQKLIIAKFEKEINTNLKSINYLTKQLVAKDEANIDVDFLNFD